MSDSTPIGQIVTVIRPALPGAKQIGEAIHVAEPEPEKAVAIVSKLLGPGQWIDETKTLPILEGSEDLLAGL